MTTRARVLVIVSSTLIFILLSAGVAYELTRYDREYTRLTRGSTREEVLKRFGKPGDIRKCDPTATWEGEPEGKTSITCVEEFWYFSKLGFKQWAIGFDKNGRVVTKNYLVSP
jgi:hypothetical protein